MAFSLDLKTIRTAAITLALTLVSCGTTITNEPKSATIQEKPAVEPHDGLVEYRIAETYHMGGRLEGNSLIVEPWRIVVLNARPKKPQLIALAEALHNFSPATRWVFFDDATQIERFIQAEKDPANHKFPDRWLKAHDLGTLAPFIDYGGFRWKLIAGDSDSEPETTIASFGPLMVFKRDEP